MSLDAIFIKGIDTAVFEAILAVQEAVPEQILYLQPHDGSRRIARLASAPPTSEAAVLAAFSTHEDPRHARYVAEIAGWEDKREMSETRKVVINRIIAIFQPDEYGLHEEIDDEPCINLLSVRRMRRLPAPIPLDRFVNETNQAPLSTVKVGANGWVYVEDFRSLLRGIEVGNG